MVVVWGETGDWGLGWVKAGDWGGGLGCVCCGLGVGTGGGRRLGTGELGCEGAGGAAATDRARGVRLPPVGRRD